jgi:prepilin-type processing-associated H-X9-DG protein
MCPSDPRADARSRPVLAYAVNTGRPLFMPEIADGTVFPLSQGQTVLESNKKAIAGGVFHNLWISPTRTVSLDYLSTHDGSQNTLMLSENVQATQWANPTDTSLVPWQAEVGLTWWWNFIGPVTGNWYNINKSRDATPLTEGGGQVYNEIAAGDGSPGGTTPCGWTSTYGVTASTSPNGASVAEVLLTYARPSSRHPGGVLATFCDGHTQFISETIDYTVYQQIMTPYGKLWGQGTFDASQLGN